MGEIGKGTYEEDESGGDDRSINENALEDVATVQLKRKMSERAIR